MANLFKFQVAFMLSILRISAHLGEVQLKRVETESPAPENITNIKGARAQEKNSLVQIQQMDRHTNSSHEMQGLLDGRYLWSSHEESLAIVPLSHQYRQDADPFISCPSHYWGCDDGFSCIPEAFRCNGNYDCVDGSDESWSLCTPPCSTDMFVCDDGLQCVHQYFICNGKAQCVDGSDEI